MSQFWPPVPKDSGWITPTLATGWATQGSQAVQYRLVNGEIVCHGRANGPTTADPLFTFPVGFRPDSADDLFFVVLSGTGGTPATAARLVVRPNGTVNAVGNSSPNFTGVRFRAA